MKLIQNKKLEVFVLSALVILLLGLLFQFVLPLVAPQHFTDNLLNYFKDPLRFHNLAIGQSRIVEASGWGSFTWKPENQLPGGILTVFYVLTGIKLPFWYLILNSLFIGGSAVLLHEYLMEFKVSLKWRYLIILSLLVTPTSLPSVTQVSKDIFIVFGVVSIGYSLLCLHRMKKKQFIIFLSIGSLIIFLFKDYMIEILFLGVLCFIGLQLLIKSRRTLSFVFVCILGLSILFSETYLSARYYANSTEQINEFQKKSITLATSPLSSEATIKNKEVYNYKREFPVLDIFLERLSLSNYQFLTDFPKGKENFFTESFIMSTTDALIHLPFGLSFSYFEPHPFRSRWEQGIRKGLMFTILQLEMLLAYLAYAIIFRYFFTLSHEDKMFVLGNIIICASFFLVFGFSVPNLGAMNRYRFPFLVLMKLVALYVWANKRIKPIHALQ